MCRDTWQPCVEELKSLLPAARIEIGFAYVQEVGLTTQRVGAGKLPIRVRNMLLTCCCFVQKLLEVQTVVGLLLGGDWGVAGVMVPVGVSCGWCWWPPKSCEHKNARAHPPRREGRGGLARARSLYYH